MRCLSFLYCVMWRQRYFFKEFYSSLILVLKHINLTDTGLLKKLNCKAINYYVVIQHNKYTNRGFFHNCACIYKECEVYLNRLLCPITYLPYYIDTYRLCCMYVHKIPKLLHHSYNDNTIMLQLMLLSNTSFCCFIIIHPHQQSQIQCK